VTWCLKAGTVEPEQTAVSRQRLGKHVSAAMDIYIICSERKVCEVSCESVVSRRVTE
jgi:hypothetical protein